MNNADLIAEARELLERIGHDARMLHLENAVEVVNALHRLADALEAAERECAQAVEDWGQNDEQMLAENQRLAAERDAALAENERLRDGAALVAAATPCACSAQRSRAEQAEAENERLRGFGARIRAFARDNVLHGDMTPMAERMWGRIADELDGGSDDRS